MKKCWSRERGASLAPSLDTELSRISESSQFGFTMVVYEKLSLEANIMTNAFIKASFYIKEIWLTFEFFQYAEGCL